MTGYWNRFAASAALCTALVVVPIFGAASPALPSQIDADVRDSVRLLRTTPFHPVDDQTLLDGARAALVEAAKKKGFDVDVTPIHPGSGADPISTLETAIATTASAAHASPTEFAYAAMSGMARAAGDRYTQFFTPEEYRAFNRALDPDHISGIGVIVDAEAGDGAVRLSYVIPGTPADRAGLQAGDGIAAIDGAQTKGMSVEHVSKLLRGKPGTTVRLYCTRASQIISVTIARTDVAPPTVQYRMLPDGVGYVSVLAFGRATPAEFDVALARVKDAGARALVLDLRNDGGGYVDSAIDIVSRFVARKPLVTVEERGYPDTTIRAQDDPVVGLPTTILVNAGTASASEITAGALQDDGVGILIGTRTYGKGVMQTLTALADGAAIKITTAHYLTPRKRDINLRGIDPDVRVDENRDARFGVVENDAQLRAAVGFLQKKIAAQSAVETP